MKRGTTKVLNPIERAQWNRTKRHRRDVHLSGFSSRKLDFSDKAYQRTPLLISEVHPRKPCLGTTLPYAPRNYRFALACTMAVIHAGAAVQTHPQATPSIRWMHSAVCRCTSSCRCAFAGHQSGLSMHAVTPPSGWGPRSEGILHVYVPANLC